MKSRRHLRSSKVVLSVTAALIGWGALAFGAVYPWAYRPLLIGAPAAGLAWLLWHPGLRRIDVPVAAALGVVAVAAGLQLIPLPREALMAVSPATDRLLVQYDLGYSNSKAPHALSIAPERSALGIVFLASFATLFVGLAATLRMRDVLRLAAVITALGTLLAVASIVLRVSSSHKIYGFWTPIMSGAQPFGPFVNRNHFAGWMLMALPFSIGLLWGFVARCLEQQGIGWRNRLLWLSSPQASGILLTVFAVVAMSIALVLTMSRSGIVCFIAALILSTIWFVKRIKTGLVHRVMAVMLVMTAVYLIVSWIGFQPVVERLTDRTERDVIVRRAIWGDAIRIIEDFPVTGTGLNTFGTAMLFYQTALPDFHVREAHSDYLQIAAEGGLLITVPVLVVVMLLARRIWQRFAERRDDTLGFALRAGAVTGLIAIAMQSLGEFSLQMPGNAILFTVLLAAANSRSDSTST